MEQQIPLPPTPPPPRPSSPPEIVKGFDTSRTENTTLKSLQDGLIYSGTEATHVLNPERFRLVFELSTSYITA